MRTKLPEVTIIIVDTVNYGQAVRAIRKCLEQVEPARVVFITDIHIPDADGFEVVKIDTIRSKREYSYFMIKELYKYFDTSHCLVIQHDGYILDGTKWNEDFLNYDYIGAPWIYEHNRNIGNGGFSLRSHRLQYALGTDDNISITHPEDQVIGINFRDYLEEVHSMKFPSEELADTFSYEIKEPACPTFGFHGKFHKPFRQTIVFKRSGALGDVVAVEPVLYHYHKLGYNVAIDTPPEFYSMFFNHHYVIKHLAHLEVDRIKPIFVDLDMAYESRPQQLHLLSYFEEASKHVECGEFKLTRPILNFPINESTRLLKNKYVVLHVDQRDQPGRNVYGIAWPTIVAELTIMGYDVIQIGSRNSVITTALHMQTPTLNMLMWLIAGADMFIGIDSGPSNIAVAMGIKSIIFFGQVNPHYIHPDLSNVTVIHNGPVCSQMYCWHNTVTTVGQDCYIDKTQPPCTQFKSEQLLTAIHKAIK